LFFFTADVYTLVETVCTSDLVPKMTARSIHWFRKGLRLHDNPALLAAIKDADHFWPVFILDPWFSKHGRVGVNRWRFLMESLIDLDASLSKLGSRLFVVRGSPETVIPDLVKKWKVDRITYEYDSEPYARERDKKIEDTLKGLGVDVKVEVSHTLFDLERIFDSNGGKAPLTYQRFQTVFSQLGPPAKAKPAPESLGCKTPDRTEEFDVPRTLQEMGVDSAKLETPLAAVVFPGGETSALSRLETHCERTSWVAKFEKPQTSPNALEPSTTVLSPYLKFGCLSPRLFWHRLHETLGRFNGQKSQPPVSLVGQLLWREFYYCVGAFTPNFDKMEGNPICVQVDWDENDEYFKAWKESRTGHPFIDAIMTQLRQQGWIHHLARHAVACYLTRGDLWISWERGQEVFEELLLDADWSLNAGNWMWLSASAFFHQYYRVYSPVAFGKKTDKSGEYIRKWLPILKKFPDQYIYEPWKAPLTMQKAAGCVIGVDYPKPIVDHDVISKKNIARMKEAYARKNAKKDEDEGDKPKTSKKSSSSSSAKSKTENGKTSSSSSSAANVRPKTGTKRKANSTSGGIEKFIKKK